MSNITDKVFKKLQEHDPNVFGEVNITFDGPSIFVKGRVSTSLESVEDVINEVFQVEHPNALVFYSLETRKSGLIVRAADTESTAVSSRDDEGELDQVITLFQGDMPINRIVENPNYKRVNHETLDKVRAAHDVLGVITPIILDRHLKVIDGGLRLEIAKLNGLKNVPVMVVNAEGKKADALRLLLNRSGEFQRWLYEEVDVFVDNTPQIQPILEPLGFFGNKILPTTFFGNTILNYHIDEYNSQMQMYSQDYGLAEWAEMRRQEILAEEESKKAKRNTKRSTEGLVSLFDLAPKDEDFVETTNAAKVIRSHVVEMQGVAEVITNNYDEIRKAEKEAKGQDWQTSRRTSKKKAADLRAEAEAALNSENDDD